MYDGSTCKAATIVPQRAAAAVSCSDALEHHLKTHMAGLLIINNKENAGRTYLLVAGVRSSWCSLMRQPRAFPLHLRQPGGFGSCRNPHLLLLRLYCFRFCCACTVAAAAVAAAAGDSAGDRLVRPRLQAPTAFVGVSHRPATAFTKFPKLALFGSISKLGFGAHQVGSMIHSA